MNLKLMNIMNEYLNISIPDNPVYIDVTVISGDEIAEVFYHSSHMKIDISKELCKERSLDMFWGRHVLYSKADNINNIEKFNSRSKESEIWWK